MVILYIKQNSPKIVQFFVGFGLGLVGPNTSKISLHVSSGVRKSYACMPPFLDFLDSLCLKMPSLSIVLLWTFMNCYINLAKSHTNMHHMWEMIKILTQLSSCFFITEKNRRYCL